MSVRRCMQFERGEGKTTIVMIFGRSLINLRVITTAGNERLKLKQ